MFSTARTAAMRLSEQGNRRQTEGQPARIGYVRGVHEAITVWKKWSACAAPSGNNFPGATGIFPGSSAAAQADVVLSPINKVERSLIRRMMTR